MTFEKIPYKIYLTEDEMPMNWYNVRADMKTKPAPLLNPATGTPMGFDDLRPVFCDELIRQELDNDTREIPIPQEIRDFYKMYRPSPLVRAYCLEEKLQTPAKIYYKFEGNNTSGSHKLNSAIAQAYYAKNQGLKGVTTETGAGQWGTALSMACSYLGLDCQVYMVKVSYEQKPFRREVMRTYGAAVTPSPSDTTSVGRAILKEHPGTTGSLGCAISEAVEAAASQPGYRYVLGSVLNQVLLHQSIIGLESNVPVRSDLVMLHHFKSRGNKGMGIVFVAGFHVEEMAQKTDKLFGLGLIFTIDANMFQSIGYCHGGHSSSFEHSHWALS